MTIPELKEALTIRGIKFKQGDRKKDLIDKLMGFQLNPEQVKKYKPEAVKREIKTQTEPFTYGPPPPSGISSSEEDKYKRLKQAAAEYENQEEARYDVSSSSGAEALSPNTPKSQMTARDDVSGLSWFNVLSPPTLNSARDDDGYDDSSSSELEGLSQFDGLSSYDGSDLYDPRAKRSPSNDGGYDV
jgi:hypothetical protein